MFLNGESLGLLGPLFPPKVHARFGVYVEMCITIMIIVIIVIITAINGLLTGLAAPALEQSFKT